MDLKDYLRGRKPKGFVPGRVFYSKVGDILEVYWDDGAPDGGFADPVSDQLTVVRAFSDKRPIGVKIYDVKSKVGDK